MEAGPPRRDPTLRVVAMARPEVVLQKTGDGRIVVLSGSIPFEAKADGSLEPIVPLAALAPVFPESETLMGFSEPWVGLERIDGPLSGGFFLSSIVPTKKSWSVASGKLQPTKPLGAEHLVRFHDRLLGASGRRLVWIDDADQALPLPVLPEDAPAILSLEVQSDGALVVLARGRDTRLRAYLFSSTWKPGEAPALVEPEVSAGCRPVPSFDRSVVVQCPAKDGSTLHRIDAGGFRRVFEDAPARFGSASIGEDGALYLAFEDELAVRRCPAPRGACTKIAVTSELGELTTTEYESVYTDVVERDGNRSWQGLRVSTTSFGSPAGGHAIFARSEDDVWLLARTPGRSLVLHAGASRPRVQLPSALDARVMIRNASPPQLWTGHCEHVFVRLGSRDADALAKREPEITKALGLEPTSFSGAFQWSLVEGRLHEDHVTGVVVTHRDPEEKLEAMERAVERLATAFSTSPTSRPQVTCTLPVLERKLVPAQ